jgi:hypothetical protein
MHGSWPPRGVTTISQQMVSTIELPLVAPALEGTPPVS